MRTFNESRERAEQDGSEYRYGAIAVDLAAVPIGLRLQNLPVGVPQYTSVFDSQGCASRSPNNIMEEKLTYLLPRLPTQLRDWLYNNGYVVNGRVVLCDAFTEILSGTTRDGASLKAPVDAIYRYGVIPAYMLPMEEGMTWEQYMDPKRITKQMRDLGQQFLLRFGINYEKVDREQFTDATEDDLLSVAIDAYGPVENGITQDPGGAFNHAVVKVDNIPHVFDGYEPYLHTLSKSYRFFDWGYSISITRITPDPVEELSRLAKILQTVLAWLEEARRKAVKLGAKLKA